jgi:hypothetical protein
MLLYKKTVNQMSFIKRRNLEALPVIENILYIQIREAIAKIGVPMIIYHSLNTLTKYRGKDPLEHKKIKTRKHKLKYFLNFLNHVYLKKKLRDERYKDQNIKIVKIIITKNDNIIFVYEKNE